MLSLSAPERPVYRTTVTQSEDDRTEQQKLDAKTPGFATYVDLEGERGPADDVGTAIARTPGATVRSIGGLGQFSSVSLRGSSPQQVAVFLDGVPIASSMAGLVDIGQLPVDGLSGIEVYRGHVPVAFGSAAVGGAINLVSRVERDHDAGPRARVDGGVGSFGARQTRGSVAIPLHPVGIFSARVGYAGAQGDFPFYDNGGTVLFTGDDSTQRRVGNHYDRVLGQVRLDAHRGPWRVGAQQIAGFRRQGIAGPIGAPARRAELDTLISRTTAKIQHTRFGRPGGQLTWVFGLGIERRAFRDPEGEIGVGIDDQITAGIDTYASPRLRVPLWRGAFLRIVADQRTEIAEVDQRGPPGPTSGDATRTRVAFGAGVELEQFLLDGRWLIVPVLRADALDSRFAAPTGGGEQGDTGRDDLDAGFAPRLGTRFRVLPALELRGSGGRYFRPPTLLELFGDRGYAVGNEGLVAERGTAIDGGIVVHANRIGIQAQVAGFATWSTDLIQWVAAGPVARPENVAGALVRGVEAALSTEARRPLGLYISYTFLDSEDRTDDPSRRGRPLPGRPRHDLFARGSAGYEWRVRGVTVEPRLLYTVDVIAGTFLDPSGRFALPTRALQGLGAEVRLMRRARLNIEVRNLLDVRTGAVAFPVQNASAVPVAVSDFIGFPLPGRTVWGSLEVQMDLRRRR